MDEQTYYSQEEVKQHRKEYAKEYNARPDIKARRQAREQTEEHKQNRREWQKKYRMTPEAKEYKRKYSQQYLANPGNKQRKKNYYLNNKPRKKELDIKKLYGLTIQEYNDLLTKQNNKCEICHKEFDPTQPRSICIDHNHTTNKVRGLLCLHCNFTIGLAKENKRILQNAIEYLKAGEESHETNQNDST